MNSSFLSIFFLFFFSFRDRVSLCSPGCPGTYSVDQVGLALRNPPASVSQSAGIIGVRHHRPARILSLKNQNKSEKELAGGTRAMSTDVAQPLHTGALSPAVVTYIRPASWHSQLRR